MTSDSKIDRRVLLVTGASLGTTLAASADASPAKSHHYKRHWQFGLLPTPSGATLVTSSGLVRIVFSTSGAVSIIRDAPQDGEIYVVGYNIEKTPGITEADIAAKVRAKIEDLKKANPGIRTAPPSEDTVADDNLGFFLPPESLATDVVLDGTTLKRGDIEVRIDKKTGHIAFYRRGKLILTDTGTSPVTTFDMAEDSDLYGLGQFRDALPNYRNQSVYLAQANMDACNPVLVSPHGFGLLWDTHTDSHFNNAGKRLTYTNTAPVTRYHVFLGDDLAKTPLDGVIATYRRLTGKAALLGKYAYGYWQSQERYHTAGELTGMVDAYRSRNLPLDVIVQDWHYWGADDLFSGMVWDPATYPDPKGMCTHIHKQNAHVIASVWPAFGPSSQVYRDLDAANLLFKGPHWGGGKVLDITSEKARRIYWSHISDGLMSVGLDGLWTDGCEPEFMSTGSRYVTAKSYAENGDCAAGPIKDHLLTFSYYQTRLIHIQARAENPAKRPLILSRKVYAGQQAFGAVTWSGDQFAAWQTLNYQIVAAQQFSLSGAPWWTDDIGGFLVSHRFPGKIDDPAYRELYVRWFQFGAFMPVFRAHGTEIRREVWAFGDPGDETYDALKASLELRYALMPYIYSHAAQVARNDETFLRPLVMDYGHDPKIADRPNQYLFGHDILVAVVNTPLDHTPDNLYEFIPNYAVSGIDAPAPEVQFYEGAHFDKLIDTRHSDDLKMSWSGDIPYALKGKPYSARWKGKIEALESGRHQFSIITQGLVKFSLDGVTKIASKGSDTGTATKANGGVSFAGHNGDDAYTFDMVLKKGQSYVFELTQSQPTPDVVSLWVEWIRPSRKADLQVSPDKRFEVYLPAGHDWYDLHTKARLSGGQTLSLRPALGDMPVFVRAGAIIPMTPGIQYANQTPDHRELHVYAGADGNFTLYDDEGDGHGYETGAFSLWPISWDDASRTLTFHPAKGTYPGILSSAAFLVSVHDGTGGHAPVTTIVTRGQTHSVPL